MGHHCWPRESEWEGNSGRKRVCSCPLVCLVQNWFKAAGHRKEAALHSGHVPETSSRGSTIAIQQHRLQTPKWVCSVLQSPTWQFATCSTSPAPLPAPAASSVLFLSVTHLYTFTISPSRSSFSHHFFLTFTVHPVTMLWSVNTILLQSPN